MSLQTPRFEVDPPVVLAPMAGITNQAFRRLCREYGAGLYVSEMVTSRALIERSPETIRMVTPDPDEQIRSVQLYGVDPEVMSKAVEMLIREDRADHIDLNMGCPVPKVTKKGGGAALPWKQDLFKDIGIDSKSEKRTIEAQNLERPSSNRHDPSSKSWVERTSSPGSIGRSGAREA